MTVSNLLDGKTLSQTIRLQIRNKIEQIKEKSGFAPGLAVVLVGDNPSSHIYVEHKQKACAQVGIRSTLHMLTSSVTQAELLDVIVKLNQDDSIHGILVQLPLPPHIETDKIVEAIDPNKDVDGFHPYNLGCLAQRRPSLRPCTPYGIIRLLEHYGVTMTSQNAVVVGASNLVGRPMALEFLLQGATTTICHRFTTNLPEHVNNAHILVVATGKKDLVDPAWVKPGITIIDVGIHRLPDQSIRGDLDFAAFQAKAKWITPVPGGVGPMTVTILLENTLLAAERAVLMGFYAK